MPNSTFRTNLLANPALYFALLIPLMPKIMVGEGIYMYAFDIMMVLLIFPILILNINAFFSLSLSRLLLLYWVFILFSTMLFGGLVDFPIIGLTKVFKGLIYIPLVYFAYISKRQTLRIIVFISILAQSINLMLFINSVLQNGFSIWRSNLLSAGFSCQFFSLTDFSVNLIPDQGASGIWGSYCLLSLAVAIYLKRKGEIGNLTLFTILILSVINVGSTISRESLLVLIVMFSLYLILNGKKNLLKGLSFVIIFISIFATTLITFDVNFSAIPILAKLSYTLSSVQSSGTESNIALRIGAWGLILYILLSNPVFLLLGIGYNLKLLSSLMDNYASDAGIKYYVALPESLFMFSLTFGGVVSLICIVIFIANSFKLFSVDKDSRILVYFLFGVCLSNALSGASLISDLLYSQFLIVVGSFVRFSRYTVGRE